MLIASLRKSFRRATLLPLFLSAIFIFNSRIFAQSLAGQSPTAHPQPAKASVLKQQRPAKPGEPGPPCAYASKVVQRNGEATLSALRQGIKVGQTYYADGCVDLHYQDARLRADHVEWNQLTDVITARGHVQLDYLSQHVEADDARYELRTGRGEFHHVRATFAVQRKPQPTLLVSPNPLSFYAEEAERRDENTYEIRGAWLTVCDPNRPVWKFYAPRIIVHLQRSALLENGNFRLYSVPILYLPYATFPVQRRASGFTVPSLGQSSRKGYIAGDQFYWAPKDWMDATIGGDYYSARGWSQNAQVRIKPWGDASLDATYFGVIDRGLPQPGGTRINQGGHEAHLLFTSDLPGNWRAVADLDQLSSLTFRLAWSENFSQAVNSEVRNTAFLTRNFEGFSLNFAALSYQNFLNATASTSITLRSAPEFRLGSVDRPLFGPGGVFRNFLDRLPVYFSFEGFTGAAHRGDTATGFDTGRFVERSEFAPEAELPLHWGPWLSVTPSFTWRSTYYGGQQTATTQNGVPTTLFEDQSFTRNTEEFSLDIRPPSFERIWGGEESKWKHAIEPDVTYRYVTGVNDFGRFVRFDEDETLTDTNEVEYGFTQRLFHKSTAGPGSEILSWQVAQKYFFDPTFGGALVPGARNVFQTLDALTPFAFADEPRHFSPIVSDLTLEPGARFDSQFIVNYDPRLGSLTAIGTLLKMRPWRQSFLTVAQFSTRDLPLNPAAPRSNQIRALAGWGDLNRPGWNVTFGASYDATQQVFQNQIAEISYNGSCCGIGAEYRKFSFGNIRNENQYLLVFRIANLGSAGNLRRPEKVF